MNKLYCRFDSPSPNASVVVRSDQEPASSPKEHMDMLGQKVLLKGNKYAYIICQVNVFFHHTFSH